MSKIDKKLFKKFVEILKADKGRSKKYLINVLTNISSQLGITLTENEINTIIELINQFIKENN